MLTLIDLVKRYPAMAGIDPDRFDIFQSDAVLIMGNDDGRWLNFYDPAQAALIAHRITQFGGTDGEDGADMTAGPVTRTDVDDVQVEFADRIWDKIPYQEADLFSTAYGQDYVRWRRMAFAGPRIA
ncbi:virion structural protein [Pantoea phage vB_PagM_SSEM1]|uniref:Putative head-tail adaptor n=1 Tax=Pantoea phage vB_PagM_SSEM1 TaxID=2721760 RepID=A0A6H0D9R2_9CAUD|nr:virion structural protein [Pantoea phage vB_PagM_SSEM1]QIS79331.1 putative head-tail adaptor [Pantoea phage vB_PagM_SSEM1]